MNPVIRGLATCSWPPSTCTHKASHQCPLIREGIIILPSAVWQYGHKCIHICNACSKHRVSQGWHGRHKKKKHIHVHSYMVLKHHHGLCVWLDAWCMLCTPSAYPVLFTHLFRCHCLAACSRCHAVVYPMPSPIGVSAILTYRLDGGLLGMGVMVVALEGRKKQYSGDTTQADWVRCPCVPAGVMVVTLPDYLIGFPGLLFSKDVGCKVLSGVVVMSTPVHRGAVAHSSDVISVRCLNKSAVSIKTNLPATLTSPSRPWTSRHEWPQDAGEDIRALLDVSSAWITGSITQLRMVLIISEISSYSLATEYTGCASSNVVLQRNKRACRRQRC